MLIILGAVLGSCARFYFINQMELYARVSFVRIFYLNTFASFLFGYFLSLVPRFEPPNSFSLIFFVGFLGCFSTFSAFIFDLFDLFSKKRNYQALCFVIGSIVFSLIALVSGHRLGNA